MTGGAGLEGGRFLVPNWERFQHYTKRNPPWIKLHRDLVDGEAETAFRWARLEAAAAKLLIELWLVAAGDDPVHVNGDGRLRGQVPGPAILCWKLRRPEAETVQLLRVLVDQGWLLDPDDLLGCQRNASTPLAFGQRDATPEAEAEAETETEGEGAKLAPTPWKVIEIPCIYSKATPNPATWALSRDHLAKLMAEYGTVNVLQVAEDMARKVRSGAQAPYTVRGMPRALARWCESEFKRQRENTAASRVGEPTGDEDQVADFNRELAALLLALEVSRDAHHQAGRQPVTWALGRALEAVEGIIEDEKGTMAFETLEATEKLMHDELVETLDSSQAEALEAEAHNKAIAGTANGTDTTRSVQAHRAALIRERFNVPRFM